MRSPIFQYAAEMYRDMRREFGVVLEAAYAAAEEGTHGSLLNARGRREPVTAYSLLIGPWPRVEKYGSPELIEWFNEVGRPSVHDYEREWLHAWTQEEPEPPVELQDAAEMYAMLRALNAAYPSEVRTIVGDEWAERLALRPTSPGDTSWWPSSWHKADC
jgi:hypothetical protein